MSGFKKIVQTVIAEKVISAVWDKISNGNRSKGSMYPFRLPKESTSQKPQKPKPTKKEIRRMVTNYLATKNGFSAGSSTKILYHADVRKAVRNAEQKATKALLKKIGLA